MPTHSEYYINHNKALPKEEIALRLTEAYAKQRDDSGYGYGYVCIYDAYEYFMTKLKEENNNGNEN